MKRWLSFAAVFALAAAGLVLSQARKAEAPAAPTALFYLVADSERELTRLPMKYTEIPDDQEVRIGNRIAEAMVEANQTDEDKLVEAYVQKVGSRLAANAHRKLPYKFHYISNSYFINAFAIPGGHVFIGAGLLALMENEDELAAVLGHEIEHIDHRHCAERLQTEAALRKVPLGELLAIPVALFQAGYNKDQEFEADREGTRLSVAAGYSPQGAIEIFSEFQKIEEELSGKRKASPAEEISGTAVQILTGYFQSHPPSADRIAQIRNLIAQNRWTLAAEKPLGVRYIFLGHKAEELVASAKYDKAIQAANAALQLQPGYPPALVALAEASCATNDFSRAAEAYKQLIATRLAEADAIRRFADDRAKAAMQKKHFNEAAKFASFSLDLQPNNPNSLKLLAEARLELGDADAALEIGHKLQKLYPDTGDELLRDADNASREAFSARNYARAAFFASYSVRLSIALEPDIQNELAQSQFALADFSAAAESYRKLISANIRDELTLDPSLISAYADSLGSITHHADVAEQFQVTLRPAKNISPDLQSRMKMEQAGLLVVVGNDSMARPLAEGPVSFAPEQAARLGWWYYRSSRFDAADKTLRRFLSQRPGDPGLQTTLGWVELEENAPQDALHHFEPYSHRFETYSNDSGASRVALAGMATARWRLGQRDAALSQFDQLAREAPEWTNPRWVSALYGPVAAQSMQEMYAEQQRRIEARKRPPATR